MGIRGKKSAAELSVVSLAVRLPPPLPGMTEKQAAIWRMVVATKPADWWAADSYPLLVSYCRAWETADLLQDKIDTFDPEWLDSDGGLKRYERLLKMRSLQVANMTSLATKMRLSQQSRYRGESADAKNKGPANGGKLWERANVG